MPRLPTFTPRQLIKLLEEHGFVLDRSKGSHQIFYHPLTGRRAVVPFHNQDLPKGTVVSILKQAGIERAEFDE